MALATLTIDINARLASLEKDMGRMAQIAQREADRMEAAFSAAGVTLAGLFAGVSVGALTSGFVGLVNQLDALNDAADATGSSIEKISGLEDIAMRTGASLEDVTSIMVKFNGVLKEADGKNGVSQALKAIGLDANELRKMDPADALLETSKALNQFEDDGNKARLVQELFGKSVKEAAPFLKDLADAGQINAKYTKEQAEQAEKFNKQMFELQANISSAARTVVADWLPAINRMFAVFQDKDASTVASQIKEFEDALRKEPYNTAYKARLDELRAAYAAISQEAKVAAGLLDAGGGRGFVNPDQVKPKVRDFSVHDSKSEKPKAERISEIQREIEALERKLQAAKRLTEVERVLDDLEKGRFKDGKVSDIGKAFDLASQIDQAKE
ncbi:MAG TPA: hypothetical protein VFM48_07490, partial [Aquabacterium sp.]|nr:hypothetical protein [Aquabacterium sp.]